LRVKYDGWKKPSGVALAKRWAYAQPEVSKWLRVMAGEAVTARISLPGAHTVGLICLKEGINADWVLAARGEPFTAGEKTTFASVNQTADAALGEVEDQTTPPSTRAKGSR
jgi:hypothetical protein